MNFRTRLWHLVHTDGLRRISSSISRFLIRLGLFPKKKTFDILDFHFTTTTLEVHKLAKIYRDLDISPNLKRISLLHIPKTAGTSIRIGIGRSLGVAPITGYKKIESVPPELWHLFDFWPYFAGHANAVYFPESHTGVTLFREPRSRILSGYRQIERSFSHTSSKRVPQGSIRRQNWESLVSNSFSYWLSEIYDRSSARMFFTDAEHEFKKFVEKETDSAIKHQLFCGLQKVHYASWIHDPERIQEMLNQAVGKIVRIPDVNVFNPKTSHRLIYLTVEDLEMLTYQTREDNLLIDLAVDKGLIRKIDQNEADRLFIESAERLGFKLP